MLGARRKLCEVNCESHDPSSAQHEPPFDDQAALFERAPERDIKDSFELWLFGRAGVTKKE
jgi:hypothetical protein